MVETDLVKKTESIRVHLSEDVLDDLGALAAHDSRTVSEYVCLLIERHMYGHPNTRKARGIAGADGAGAARKGPA